MTCAFLPSPSPLGPYLRVPVWIWLCSVRGFLWLCGFSRCQILVSGFDLQDQGSKVLDVVITTYKIRGIEITLLLPWNHLHLLGYNHGNGFRILMFRALCRRHFYVRSYQYVNCYIHLCLALSLNKIRNSSAIFYVFETSLLSILVPRINIQLLTILGVLGCLC